MRDSWSSVMAQRFRMAARTPPDATALRAPAQQMARAVMARQVERGRAPRLSVQTARNRLTVTGSPSATAEMRRELAKNRRQLVAAVRAEAQAKIGGGS